MAHVWLIRRDVFLKLSGFQFKDGVLLVKQSFHELIMCLFVITNKRTACRGLLLSHTFEHFIGW